MTPLPQSDLPPAESAVPAGSPGACEFTWVNVLLGQLLRRACPCVPGVDACNGCQVGCLCRCAQAHPWAGGIAESRFWVFLVLCFGLALFSWVTSAVRGF